MSERDDQQTQLPIRQEKRFAIVRKVALKVLCILSTLLGAGAIVLGIHDLLLSTRAAGRAIGAVFLVGGVLLFASAIAVLRSDSRVTRGWALPGFVLGMIPGTTLALIQFGG